MPVLVHSGLLVRVACYVHLTPSTLMRLSKYLVKVKIIKLIFSILLLLFIFLRTLLKHPRPENLDGFINMIRRLILRQNEYYILGYNAVWPVESTDVCSAFRFHAGFFLGLFFGPVDHCFSTAGSRPGIGPWHQLYRALRV
jgi:hypothetical protein